MRKIKWISLLFCIVFIWTITDLFDADSYHDFVYRHRDSPGASWLYVLMRTIDKCVGRIGVIILLSTIALCCLYFFYKENMNSIYRRYRDYKESGDWKCLFRNK